MRVLGVDPGSRRIGLAMGDSEVGIASPLAPLSTSARASAQQVAERAAQEGAAKIVIGLPLQLDGRAGEAARRANQLAEQVRALSGLETVLWDERLTTHAAEASLRRARVRGPRRRALRDSVAAALILQSYFDARAIAAVEHEESDAR